MYDAKPVTNSVNAQVAAEIDLEVAVNDEQAIAVALLCVGREPERLDPTSREVQENLARARAFAAGAL